MRKLAILLLVVLVLSLGSVSLAQTDLPLQCGSLSTADCSLLTDSATAMQTLNSATFDLNLQFVTENIPDSPDQSISLSANGSYATDIMALQADLGQIADSQFDLQVLATSLASVIKSINTDLNFNLSLPADVMASIAPTAGTDPINIQLRMVDGVGYLNFDPLDAIAGGQLSQSGMTGWMGLDIAGAVTQMFPMLEGSMPDMSSIMGDSQSGSSSTMDDLTAMMNLQSVQKYFIVTRQADADGSAVFVTNVDLAGLINDPDFQKEAYTLVSSQDPTITEDQYMADLNTFATSLGSFTVNVTQAIDINSKYLRSQEFALVVNMDTSKLPDMTSSDPNMMQVSINASIALDNFNDAPTITAPENATVVPLAALFGGMGGQ